MISFGLTFIFANLLYLLFSIATGFVTYKVLTKKEFLTVRKRRWFSVGVFAFVLVLPFYDLLIQKAVKTYYQTFKMNSTIYAYPEKDEDGKIESLGVGTKHRESYVLNVLTKQEKRSAFFSFYNQYVKDFIDVHTFEDREYDTANGKFLVETTIGEKLLHIDLIEKSHDFVDHSQARYALISEPYEPQFFGLYYKQVYKLTDQKTNIVLATAWKLQFPTGKAKRFRVRYLLWQGPSGVEFGIKWVDNVEQIVNKTLGFGLWF